MSDWIEHNGKKYYEESYLILANENAKRLSQDTKRLDWYLHRSRVSNMTYIKTGSESDYLSGMRKWIDECLNAGEV